MRKETTQTLLVGMKLSAATVKTGIQVPQRAGNAIISIQRIKIHVKKTSTCMPMFISHNSQDMEINLSVH